MFVSWIVSGITDLDSSHIDTSVLNRSHITVGNKKHSSAKNSQMNKSALSPDEHSVISPDSAINTSRSFIMNSSMNGGKRQKLNDRFGDSSVLDESVILSPQRTTKVCET